MTANQPRELTIGRRPVALVLCLFAAPLALSSCSLLGGRSNHEAAPVTLQSSATSSEQDTGSATGSTDASSTSGASTTGVASSTAGAVSPGGAWPAVPT